MPTKEIATTAMTLLGKYNDANNETLGQQWAFGNTR
jgi:hypothetical protein